MSLLLTRAQRMALKRVFDRSPLYPASGKAGFTSQQAGPTDRPISYRAFRRNVHPTFGCDNAVCVPWCGMWLAIETDGYVHS